MNASTKLCKPCLAAGVQVVAAVGDLCEYHAKGEVHPAVLLAHADSGVKGAAKSKPNQTSRPRSSRWDESVFNALRRTPGETIVLRFRTSGEAESAYNGIYILNRSRNLSGLTMSRKGRTLAVWISREGQAKSGSEVIP